MRRVILIMAVIGSLILVSCGGASRASTTIDVTMTDFQFQPNVFTVPAGEQITFKSSNNGSVIHNFVIMKLGTSAGDFFEEEDVPNVYWEVEVVPGGSADTSFTAPSEPGQYEVICRTEGHIVSGMTARLNVVAPEE